MQEAFLHIIWPNVLKKLRGKISKTQTCIEQAFIVPNNQRVWFGFSYLFLKALAMSTALVSLVCYLSLFSVLCSCNKIYLLRISCFAFSFFCCYCGGNMSYPPTAVHFVCWKHPPHSFFFVRFYWGSGNNHWTDLWAPRVREWPWKLRD